MIPAPEGHPLHQGKAHNVNAVGCHNRNIGKPVLSLNIPCDLSESLAKIISIRSWRAFSMQGQRVNIFNFAGCTISVTTTQLSHCSSGTDVQNINEMRMSYL